MKAFKFLPIFVLCSSVAHAEFWSGNDLLNHIQSSEPLERTWALGYVMGAFDASKNVLHCSNVDGITAGQVRDIVKNYLVSNPQYRHMAADLIVGVSIGTVWPCPKKKSGGSSL